MEKPSVPVDEPYDQSWKLEGPSVGWWFDPLLSFKALIGAALWVWFGSVVISAILLLRYQFHMAAGEESPFSGLLDLAATLPFSFIAPIFLAFGALWMTPETYCNAIGKGDRKSIAVLKAAGCIIFFYLLASGLQTYNTPDPYGVNF